MFHFHSSSSYLLLFFIFIQILFIKHSATCESTLSLLTSYRTDNSHNASINPTTHQSSGSNLAGETCILSSDCARGLCIRLTGSDVAECSGDHNSCICSLSECSSVSDCLSTEQCVQQSSGKSCVSPNARLRKRAGSLTLGACRELNDCATGRDCYSVDDVNQVKLCSSTSKACACFPMLLELCANDGSKAGCLDGEVCKKINQDSNFCVDPKFAKLTESTTTPSTSETNNPSKTETSDPKDGGFTFDQCRNDDQCLGIRNCVVSVNNEVLKCSSSDKVCLCTPPLFENCKTESDCSESGETCAELGKNKLCYSKTAAKAFKGANTNVSGGGNTSSDSPSSTVNEVTAIEEAKEPSKPKITKKPESTDDEPEIEGGESPATEGSIDRSVCIAAYELKHLSTDNLVYPNHRNAYVLCDKYSSCATPGHMVHYQGLPMMMRKYCSIVHGGCKKQVMQVNSPRWSRKLRITSKSPALEYTAFAARYETNAEEHVLKYLIRVGL